jgi:hypothetical protein
LVVVVVVVVAAAAAAAAAAAEDDDHMTATTPAPGPSLCHFERCRALWVAAAYVTCHTLPIAGQNVTKRNRDERSEGYKDPAGKCATYATAASCASLSLGRPNTNRSRALWSWVLGVSSGSV